MTKKILIINSDSPNNRGDRAILEGNLKLIKKSWPNSEVWALSEYSERDSEWYGIHFLPYSAYTTNPLHIIRIALFSRKCDYVFWGGGEILKDYTNKIGIIYWYMRILSIRLFNNNIYGAFQGIGPTSSDVSKKLIVATVNLTRLFFVRDDESREKLESWGIKVPIVSSYDPAVLNQETIFTNETYTSLKEDYDIDKRFLENSIGVGLRRWFHYKRGGFIPYKFRFWETKKQLSNPQLDTYTKNTAALLDKIIEKHDVNVIFFPMFNAPPEGDDLFSKSVTSLMKNGERTRIIDKDNFSPQQYLNIVARCKLFIAARLHSSIIATSSGVPAVVFYYVDKGRLFFEQLKMTHYSQSIETLLDERNLPEIYSQVEEILVKRSEVKEKIDTNILAMREKLYNDFARVSETSKGE